MSTRQNLNKVEVDGMKRILVFVLVLIMIVTSCAISEDAELYYPFGIQWGESLEDVESILNSMGLKTFNGYAGVSITNPRESNLTAMGHKIKSAKFTGRSGLSYAEIEFEGIKSDEYIMHEYTLGVALAGFNDFIYGLHEQYGEATSAAFFRTSYNASDAIKILDTVDQTLLTYDDMDSIDDLNELFAKDQFFGAAGCGIMLVFNNVRCDLYIEIDRNTITASEMLYYYSEPYGVLEELHETYAPEITPEPRDANLFG